MILRRPRPPDEVERYLRRLSRWTPRRARHDLVCEARRHLFDAIGRAERAGLDRSGAQRKAIQEFGPAWRIGLAARGWNGGRLAELCARVAGRFRRGGRFRRLHRMRRPRWRVQ